RCKCQETRIKRMVRAVSKDGQLIAATAILSTSTRLRPAAQGPSNQFRRPQVENFIHAIHAKSRRAPTDQPGNPDSGGVLATTNDDESATCASLAHDASRCTTIIETRFRASA